MPYIKKLVLKGFKSFAPQTEIPLSNSMNVIVGPNGTGKSNITDAICFVLGRLSIKSMRAAKTANLIFAGNKTYKPAGEASVKIILDNSDKKIPVDNSEIIVERIVRSTGQGIYKINNETKTRQEVLELLSSSGIDPYGFNIVLQGEINSIVRMHAEERRKIIEEVAGISVYELRKQKSIKEIEKTEDKLKEVQTTLRERTSYLKNLEEERKQALRYKKLQETEKRCKAGILKRKVESKNKEITTLNDNLSGKDKAKSKLKKEAENIQENIQELEEKINSLNKNIQTSTGVEQDALNAEISNIRAELAGLNVRKENNEARIQEIQAKRNKTEEEIKNLKAELGKLEKDFPSQAEKYKEIENKKNELDELEKQRKTFYNLKEKLNAIKDKLSDKKQQLQKNKDETSFLLKEADKIAQDLAYKELEKCSENIAKLKGENSSLEKEISQKEQKFREIEKIISINTAEIANLEKIKEQVTKLDVCPLCKSKITEEHIKEVLDDCKTKISSMSSKIKELDENKVMEESEKLRKNLSLSKSNLEKAESDLIKLENIEDKKNQIKKLNDEQATLESEISNLEKDRLSTDTKVSNFKDIEDKHDKLFLELQEISLRTKENLDAELDFKQRDIEKANLQIKQNIREEQELSEELGEIESEIQEKENLLSEKEDEEHELEKKFKNLLDRKSSFEKKIHENNKLILEVRNNMGNVESEINNLKIEKAKLDAEKENFETDLEVFKDISPLNLALPMLQEKLEKTQRILDSIGSVNLRALEVYDKMKTEYDAIAEKVKTLENEKLEILKIIEEIDRKKKRTFMKTLKSINELFNRNFTQLSTKGQAFLELENKEDPFAGGMNIAIKVGKGKYFDVTSLSGGEQTLVALSLIFAIQEYKPYCFYIFDEVDAALDKRNSERLASLVKRYMKTGQYIIVTHNDAIITESTNLYGISMQDGISKILSLEI